MQNIKNRLITTTNILQAMSSYAADFGIRVSQVDFNIKSYVTEFRRITNKKWEKLSNIASLNKKEFASDPDIDFRQIYKIELKPKLITDDFKFISKISTNALETKVFITVDKKSIFKNSSKLKTLIKNEILKKKARHGFFIGAWETKLDTDILDLISSLVDSRLIQNKQIMASFVPFANDVVDAHIRFHIPGLSVGKNAIVNIKNGDLIMEYYKPKSREKSRSASGKYIPNLTAKNTTLVTQVISQKDIQIVEDRDKISYYANKDGFFKYGPKEFRIVDEINVRNLNFKESGYIVADLEDDIEINVKELDPSKDAISTGVVITVQKLNVVGNIASNTTITTKLFNSIGGGVQRGSTVVTEHAEIKMLKGNLTTKTAVIHTLENGVIYADEVEITNAFGGKVYANKIVVKKANSHTKFIAKTLIDIDNVVGHGNHFVIDIYANQKIKSQFKIIKAELELIKDKIRENFSINMHKTRIKEIKIALVKTINRINDFKKKRISPPKFLKDEVDRFQTELKIEKYFLHNKGIKTIVSIYENNLKRLSRLVYKGVIISQQGFKNGSMNKIIFEKRYMGNKVEYIPKTKEKKFMLQNIEGEDMVISKTVI